MKQLNNLTLPMLAESGVDIPNYRLAENPPKIGIVHIGPGAFFRGHQAWYTHQALAQFGGDWAISAVSMRSSGVSDALTEQQGLYTLAELDAKTSYQMIGAIEEVLIAKTQFSQVSARLLDAQTKFVTLTITEKGYCLDAKGDLDLSNKEIQTDLIRDKQPITAIGLLAFALAERKATDTQPFTILSCDNITDNGYKLKAALIAFANQFDTSLAKWIEDKLVCPCSMVDSITPATDDELRNLVSKNLSVKDNWPIKREAFVQWVIEDVLPTDSPAWQKVGATLTSDVRGFENAKLRLLNCPHSTLAYFGVLLGLETVFDTMQDQPLVDLIKTMINQEIIPSFTPPKELDVIAYSEDILARFRNPAIRHLVAQIAWDGSQKLPMRILPIIEQNLKDGNRICLLSSAVVAWFVFIRKRFIDQETLVDPLADKLLSIAKQCNNKPEHDIGLLLSITEIFPVMLASNTDFIQQLEMAYENIQQVLTGQEINISTLINMNEK